MWQFNEAEYRKWLITAAEQFNSAGVRPDLFERYSLPPDVADSGDIEKALQSTFGFWGKNKINPKLSAVLTALISEHKDAHDLLLDPERRGIEREFAIESRKKKEVARFADLRDSIAVVAGKGFITPEELASLTERYHKLGFTETEIRGQIGVVPIRADSDTLKAPRFEEGLTSAIRTQIRQQLAVLRFKNLYDFLKIAPGGAKEEWASAYERKEKEWRPRPSDSRKTAANILLGLVKTHLLDSPEKYDQARRWEIAEQLRPNVELAAKDKLIDANEFQALMKSAVTKCGLEHSDARAMIQALADECGARIESKLESTIGCANCGYTMPLKNAPEKCPTCRHSLWQDCPKCNKRVPSIAVACSNCRFVLGDSHDVELLILRAEAALKRGRLVEAAEAANTAAEKWGREGKVEAILERIENRRSQVDQLCAGIEQDFSARLLFAAETKVKELQQLAPDWEFNDGRTASDVAAEINANLKNVRAHIQSAQRSEGNAEYRAYKAALDVAQDSTEAREGIDRCLPEPPGQAFAEQHADSIDISWEASPAEGKIDYVVRRQEGRIPESTTDGVLVTETTIRSCRDPAVPPGAIVFYSIFARRGNAVSEEPSSTAGVLFASEVRNVTVKANDRSVRIAWDPVSPGARIRVVRKPKGAPDGIKIEASLTGFEDSKLQNEVTYSYNISVEYQHPSGEWLRTKGKDVTATPQAPLLPVEMAITHPRGGSVEFSWSVPHRGDVRVYCSVTRPDVRVGEVTGAATFSKLGVPLNTLEATRAVDLSPPPGICYYVPVTTAGTSAVAGRIRVVGVEDVTGVSAEDHGSKLLLRWNWPGNCNEAKVVVRSDVFADDPESDVGQFFETVPRNGAQPQGTLEIKSLALKRCFVTVFARHTVGKEVLYGPGMHPGCRTEVIMGSTYELSYWLERGKGWLGKSLRMTLHLTAPNKDIPKLPELLVVARRGTRPPEAIDEGEVLESYSGFYLPKGEDISREFELMRPPAAIRLFLADKKQQRSFRISHPNDSELSFK